MAYTTIILKYSIVCMHLRTEMTSHSEKNEDSETEYSQRKGASDRIYSQKAKEFGSHVNPVECPVYP